MPNLEYYHFIFKNNPDRLPHVISLIIDDLKTAVANTRDALAAGEYHRVHLELHKARPILFNIKEESVVDSIDRLKYLQDDQQFVDQLQHLLSELDRVITELVNSTQ